MTIGLSNYLAVAAILFTIGVVGVLTRRNAIMIAAAPAATTAERRAIGP